MENSLIKEICLFLHFYCLRKTHNIFNWKSLKSGKKFEGEYAFREMYVPLSLLRRCRSIKLVSQLNVFKHLNHQYSCLSVCLLNVHATFCIIRTKYDFRKQGIQPYSYLWFLCVDPFRNINHPDLINFFSLTRQIHKKIFKYNLHNFQTTFTTMANSSFNCYINDFLYHCFPL